MFFFVLDNLVIILLCNVVMYVAGVVSVAYTEAWQGLLGEATVGLTI